MAGVTRKRGRGYFQEKEKKKSTQIRVRGTVKIVVLYSDESCPNLVSTVYNKIRALFIYEYQVDKEVEGYL